jgi:hypothetical protein
MSYWRGAYSVPVSNYVTFKGDSAARCVATGLPLSGYNVNVGLIFGSPGYSEQSRVLSVDFPWSIVNPTFNTKSNVNFLGLFLVLAL